MLVEEWSNLRESPRWKHASGMFIGNSKLAGVAETQGERKKSGRIWEEKSNQGSDLR